MSMSNEQIPEPPGDVSSYPPAGFYPPFPHVMPSHQQNAAGTWALVLGLVSFIPFLGILTTVPGLVLGVVGRRNANAGRASNGGAALAGAILSGVVIFLYAAFLVIGALGAAMSESPGSGVATRVPQPIATQPPAMGTPPVPTNTVPQPATKAPASNANEDKGWALQSAAVKKEDFTGSFSGTIRVTNKNSDPQTATFTITLTKGGQVVGSLSGIANEVSPGKTVTVDLLSTDQYVPGPWEQDFQTNVSY